MANRVLLGNRNGTPGFFVSKPGQNVLTASDDNLLLATHLESLQIVGSGSIADSGTGAVDRGIPNLGFQPFIIFSCEKYDVRLQYLSNTSVRFQIFPGTHLESAFGPVPSRSGVIRYLVTNIQRP